MKNIIQLLIILAGTGMTLSFQSCDYAATGPSRNVEQNVSNVKDFPLINSSHWEYDIFDNMQDTFFTPQKIGSLSVDLTKVILNTPQGPDYPFSYIYNLNFQDSTNANTLLLKNDYQVMNYGYSAVKGDTIKEAEYPVELKNSTITRSYDLFVFPLTVGKVWRSSIINSQIPNSMYSIEYLILNTVKDSLNIMLRNNKLYKNVFRIVRKYYDMQKDKFYYERIDDFCPGIGIIAQRVKKFTSKNQIIYDYSFEINSYKIGQNN